MPLILPITADQRLRLLPLIAALGGTNEEREYLLESAGLEALLPKINRDTSPELFAAQTVRVAQRYGAIKPDTPALLPLLRLLREEYAGQPEIAAFLDSLLALSPTQGEPEPWLWKAFAAATLVALVGQTLYWLLVPARMPDDAAQFNVAIAPFGELRDGAVRASDNARVLSRWIADGVTREQPVYEETFGNPIEVWHDGLSPVAKRTPVGLIQGADVAARQVSAAARAADLNADVLIYGVLEPLEDGNQRLSIEFYVSPDLSAPVETRLGHFRMGEPVLLPPTLSTGGTGDSQAVSDAVMTRGRALAWLIRALDRERRGLRADMIAVLERAEAALTRLPERGTGKEVLYTLKGEAHLEIAYADLLCEEEGQSHAAAAERAFRSALASNPAYPYAAMGMGNLAHWRAQCLLTARPPFEEDLDAAAPHLDEAVARFETALENAAAAPDPPYIEALARVAVVPVHRLRAILAIQRTRFASENSEALFSEAELALDEGDEALTGALEPLPAADHRLRAKLFLAQGNLASTRALLYQLRGDTPAYEQALEAGVEAFTLCEAEANLPVPDVYLADTLIPDFCTPQKESNLCLLGRGSNC